MQFFPTCCFSFRRVMADKVAKAIRYIGQADFDLFSDSDRNAMMPLVEDYFCRDEPTEMSFGKPHLGVGIEYLP